MTAYSLAIKTVEKVAQKKMRRVFAFCFHFSGYPA